MTLVRSEVDCSTGETVVVEMTGEEEAAHLAVQEEHTAHLQAELAARDAAAEARRADLAILGSSPDPIHAALARLLGDAR